MIYAIIGSRNYHDYEQFKLTLEQYKDITEIVSGGAKGPDSMAERYAREKGINTQIFKPDWETHGRAAGFIRNTDIVKAAEVIVAFWDGKSNGTRNSLQTADKLGKKWFVHLTAA